MAEFISSAGSEIAVSAAAPATNDAAGYGALTYGDLDLVSEVGEYGPTDNEVTFTALKDAIVQKANGSRNYGQLSLQLAYSTEGDAGLAIVKTAYASRAKLSVKVTLPDGSIDYFRAICLGVTKVVGGADTVLGHTCNLSITGAIVEVAAPSA